MSVVEFLPAFLAGGVQFRAIRYDDVVAAVCRWIPDGFVFAHQEDGDSGGEAAEGGGLEFTRLGTWEGTDGGEGVVWCCGGDVMPCSGVGKFGLYALKSVFAGMGRDRTRPLVCDIFTAGHKAD